MSLSSKNRKIDELLILASITLIFILTFLVFEKVLPSTLQNITVKDPIVYTNILGVNATFYSVAAGYDAADNNRTHYSNSNCKFIITGSL